MSGGGVPPWARRAARSAGEGLRAAGAAVSDAWRSLDPALVGHLAQAPLMGLTHLAPSRAAIAPRASDGRRAVLFVHGFGGHRGNFLPMQAALRAQGRSRTLSLDAAPGAPIELLADALSARIADVRAAWRLPATDCVELVAHSMGGLVCRLALEHPATRGAVAGLVTLGTPHHGTGLARLARSAQALALRPRSEVLERLRAQDPWPAGFPPLHCFWSPQDLVLMPPESGVLPGAWAQEVAGFTHFSWLLDPRSWAHVGAALDALPRPVPDLS